MKVQPINSKTNKQTDFKALKSVNIKGLYKDYPQHASKIIETLKQNKVFQEFSSKYDVFVKLDAHINDENYNLLNSTLKIAFNNPAHILGKRFAKLFPTNAVSLKAMRELLPTDEAINQTSNEILSDIKISQLCKESRVGYLLNKCDKIIVDKLNIHKK